MFYKVKNYINKILVSFGKKYRKNRGKFFKDFFYINNKTKILDLGGGSGEYLCSLIEDKYQKQIIIADIDKKPLDRAKKKGLRTILLNEVGKLPFRHKQFDIVFCNSVIEHVTVPVEEVWNYKNGKRFIEESFKSQKQFANEIRRIAKSYYVQTPNKFFPLEPHIWFPFVQFFPRSTQVRLTRLANKFWGKNIVPDCRLLTYKELRVLFPEADIYNEKVAGIIKSFVVIKIG